jgi:hypothetical protein
MLVVVTAFAAFQLAPREKRTCGSRTSVKKAGHHVDDKGNDDRTKQVRERGVR